MTVPGSALVAQAEACAYKLKRSKAACSRVLQDPFSNCQPPRLPALSSVSRDQPAA